MTFNMHYLTTYKPLISTKQGRVAVSRFGIPPFVDGSCRREPDFESQFPSISALCHFKLFAPRLHEGDTIVYITRKGRYLETEHGHWRLVATLRVLKRFESHKDAAGWYKAKDIALPSNCLVKGNRPLPLEKTAGDENSVCDWDALYQLRAKVCGVFLACEPEFLELHKPPMLTSDKMESIFGKIPGTRNPPRISDEQFAKLKWITQRWRSV